MVWKFVLLKIITMLMLMLIILIRSDPPVSVIQILVCLLKMLILIILIRSDPPVSIIYLLSLTTSGVHDQGDAVVQEQMEVLEGPVLHAQGLQGRPVNLRGQILQQQPAWAS